MYLSGDNTTMNASLSLARNNVIWSAHLGSPEYTRQNLAEQAEIKYYYIIMRETLGHKKHLQPFNQDGDSRWYNKGECLKGATEGQQLMLNTFRYCNANAMRTHKRSPTLSRKHTRRLAPHHNTMNSRAPHYILFIPILQRKLSVGLIRLKSPTEKATGNGRHWPTYNARL